MAVGVSSCLGDQETETGLKAGQDCHLYDLSSSNIPPPPRQAAPPLSSTAIPTRWEQCFQTQNPGRTE